MAEHESGIGNIGDFIPTFFVLFVFTMAWGFVQYRDATPWIGLAIAPPIAVGMLASASVRMIVGRTMGGVGLVFAAGVFVFLVMLGMATLVAGLLGPEGSISALPVDPFQLSLSILLGVVGAFFGSFALGHYLTGEQGSLDEDEDLRDASQGADEALIDYSTEPEDLVCLLTNQVVNRDHDRYLVCHNRFNVTSVCHAVYLMDYVHLLDNRCRRCYQPLRERDLKGMGTR